MVGEVWLATTQLDLRRPREWGALKGSTSLKVEIGRWTAQQVVAGRCTWLDLDLLRALGTGLSPPVCGPPWRRGPAGRSGHWTAVKKRRSGSVSPRCSRSESRSTSASVTLAGHLTARDAALLPSTPPTSSRAASAAVAAGAWSSAASPAPAREPTRAKLADTAIPGSRLRSSDARPSGTSVASCVRSFAEASTGPRKTASTSAWHKANGGLAPQGAAPAPCGAPVVSTCTATVQACHHRCS